MDFGIGNENENEIEIEIEIGLISDRIGARSQASNRSRDILFHLFSFELGIEEVH